MLLRILTKAFKSQPTISHLINSILVLFVVVVVGAMFVFDSPVWWWHLLIALATGIFTNIYLRRIVLNPLARLGKQVEAMYRGEIIEFDHSRFRTQEVCLLARQIEGLNCRVDKAVANSIDQIALDANYDDKGIRGLNPTQRLRFDIEMLNKVLETTQDLIYVKDSQFRIVLCNQNLVNFYPGLNKEDIIGTTTAEHFEHQHQVDAFLAQDKIALEQGHSDIIETLKMPNGSTRTFHTVKTRFYDSSGRSFILGMTSDVTERETLIARLEKTNKELDESYMQVRQMAETDSLTGLYNRYYFDESLDITVASLPDDLFLGLLLVDLDHFKYINDTYGHEMGDKVLKAFADTVTELVDRYSNSLFARLGGDEFAIILPNLERPDPAARLAKDINHNIAEMEIDNLRINTSVSVGIAFVPKDALSSPEIKRYADIAMYRAKNQGRKQFCMYEESMQEQFSNSFRIESELRIALDQQHFELFYQPLFSPATGELVGFESLLRWPDMYTPDVFIPIAEESKQIIPLGRWVLHTAIKQIAQWNKETNQSLSVAVNLSPIQLEDAKLISIVQDLLLRYRLSPELLTLEITETALLRKDCRYETINALNDLGCRIALDDFGTGFSSLSHLIDFNVDKVKLDKTMLPNSDEDLKLVSVFEGLVMMIKRIDLDITAEGIETEYHHKLCKRLDIEEVQGFHYCRPKNANSFSQEFLTSGSLHHNICERSLV
jgi:diguanylate cyclase (GGDEF)-like protein/PAS domain S-box-containing protein